MLGRVYVHRGHYLACGDRGLLWLQTTVKGDFFITAHIVLIVMQAVMIEKALYAVPHHAGWFEVPIDHETFEEKEDTSQNNQINNTEEADDDNY